MRMVSGYLEPDRGDALIARRVHHATARRDAQMNLGYLAEGAPLYGDLTARAFLTCFWRAPMASHPHRSRWALDRVIHDARISRRSLIGRLKRLSKGYKRRVGLAGALMHDPPVLVLDEPTDGLDPNQKQAVRQLIARMSEDKAILDQHAPAG